MIDINGGDHNELSNVGELRRRVFLSAVGGLSILGLTSSQSAAALIETSLDEEAYLENQTVVSENQEPTHVPVVPFPDLRSAVTRTNQPTPRTEDWVHSPYYQSLDGQWQFKWSLNPSIAPETLTDADTSDWDAIEVPSCWQTKGYGHPMYRNIPIEFPLYTPPNVPDVINPVGSYVRTFAVPDDWDGRETFLHFEGAKSAYFVWVNDEYVGYDQGAMTPAEFDVTNYLTSGENTVAVQVYRWSDGTYLENQDMWRFAGIYRSVYLYSTPRTHVRDYFARATLDDSYQDGTFEVDAEVAAYGALDTGEYTVRAHLFDNPGQEVIAEDATTSVETSVLPEAFSTDGTASVSLHANVSSPKKWSAEKPNLYVLALELQDPTGKTLEVQAEKVGFRTIEVSGGPENKQVLVNGKSVEFRGVNLHDHHPDSGRTVPLDTLQQDVERMKQFNVNAVRMSHYPHNVALYDLCNEYGLYVCDEVNAETHNDPTLSSTPSWEAAFVERFRRMIQRDKNFPSVLIWSTGNEAGLGDSHFAMAAYAEKIDPDRLLYHQSNFPDGKAPYADLVGPRYPTPAHVREVAENATEERPIVLGEYAHAMGNSLGNYTAYWDIVRSIGQVQGGFVWDWVDQALERPRTTTPDAANGIDGTIMGNPAVIDGPGGGRALAFSGLDDYVELPEDPALNVTKSALTLEAWVRPQNLNTPSPGYANVFTDDVEIVEKTATDPFLVKGDQYGLRERGETTIEFFLTDGNHVSATAPVPADWRGSWHHIAGVYDGRELRLYIDGEQAAGTSHQGSIDRGHRPLNVGRDPVLHNENYAGWLSRSAVSQIRVYDRARDIGSIDVTADRKKSASDVLVKLDFDEFNENGTYRSYGVSPFCINGLVFANRDPQPETFELKGVHQPVGIEVVDLENNRVAVTNRDAFRNLDIFETRWELRADDKTLQSGTLSLDVPPGKTEKITIPFDDPNPKAGTTYWLTFDVSLSEATEWASAGHTVAHEQFEVPVETPAEPTIDLSDEEGLTVERSGSHARIAGDTFTYAFHTSRGTLSSLQYAGVELLHEGPQLDAWRPPVLNDKFRGFQGGEAKQWRAAGLDRLERTVESVAVNQRSAKVVEATVDARAAAPDADAGFTEQYRYRIFANGDVSIQHRVMPDADLGVNWLPVIGLQLGVPHRFGTVSWYGRGPQPTYPDRKSAGRVDTYESTAADLETDYVVPQDAGNLADVRWATFTDGESGLAILGSPTTNLNVEQYSNTASANYPFQLRERDAFGVRLDHAVSGLGNTLTPLAEKDQVSPDKTYEYSLVLHPLSTDAPMPMERYREELPAVMV